MQQKFDGLNNEYNTIIEQNRQNEQTRFNDKAQYTDEIKQWKNNYEQEKFDKIEKERLIEKLNEKILFEQNQNEKIQQELIQLKQELKTIHSKYDTLQVELLQLRETKTNEPVILESSHPPTSTTTRLMRSKRSAHEEVALVCFSYFFKFLNFYIGYTR
jgi:hypothetical protein